MENESNLFTNRPDFELADKDELQMAQYERILNQTIGPRTSHADITRVLQQKILMGRDNLEIITLGLLNTLLTTDNPVKFQQYFQVLQLIVQDGFDSVLMKLESIAYLKFGALRSETTLNLLKILQSFVKAKLLKAETLVVICLRQIVVEDLSERMQNYIKVYLSLLYDECDWFVTNMKSISLLFAKLIRIFSFAISAEINAYKNYTIKILQNIWQKRKDDCVKLGREFIRVMMDGFKAKDLDFITNDLKNPYKNYDSLSEYLLKNEGDEFMPAAEVIKVMIPPYLDEILTYLHFYTPAENMPRMMRWIMRDFRIQNHLVTEFLFADIARFLVLSVHPTREAIAGGATSRWRTIRFMLEVMKNDLARAILKQNVFYDWMFYQSHKDSIMKIEPGINLIKGTFIENLNLCHEVLDFLFIMSREYNPKNIVETKASIRAAFGDALKLGVTQTYDDLMSSEALDFTLREKMGSFVPTERNYEIGKNEAIENKIIEIDPNIDNTFKPTGLSPEEYNPFDDFDPFAMGDFDKPLEMHEYDPDSASRGFDYEPGNSSGYENGAARGGMELEELEGKAVDFDSKFAGLVGKIKESPNKANFETFLKEFIQYVHSNSSDDEKFIKFAETLSEHYEDSFEDILLEREDNIIKVLLRHTIEALHTVIQTYNLLKLILRGIYKVRDTISFQYLVYYYKMVNSTEKAFLEDYTSLIGGERNFEAQFSEDLGRFYSVYSQTEFNDLLIRILKDFAVYVIGKSSILNSVFELADSSCLFQLEEELVCSTMRLFPEKVSNYLLDTTTWSQNSQEDFWSLLTNQFNLSRNKEVMQIIISIRDFLNNRCKDPNFDTNQLYGLVRGFRRFFSDALKIKDDKMKFEYLVTLYDLNQRFSYILYSLLNLVEADIIRPSLKEYMKQNGDFYDKMKNLGYHALFGKTKKSYKKMEQVLNEPHTKSIFKKTFEKHKLEREFADLL